MKPKMILAYRDPHRYYNLRLQRQILTGSTKPGYGTQPLSYEERQHKLLKADCCVQLEGREKKRLYGYYTTLNISRGRFRILEMGT